MWNLRSRRCYAVLEKAFYKSLGRPHARMSCFSVQGNHVHMLVEAHDREQLGRLMQSMCIRMAKGLNKVMNGRRGAVFIERFHSRSLSTPRETRAAIVYVLQNHVKHRADAGQPLPMGWLDLEYSSASWFTGWREPLPASPRPPPVSAPGTWLLERGWWEKGGGTIGRTEMPSRRK